MFWRKVNKEPKKPKVIHLQSSAESPLLWTRSYFVSTADNVCSETIKKYIENQKKRY